MPTNALFQELKKIWRPGILICLAVLGFLFYTMYLEFYINYFPNGPQYDGLFRTAASWVEKYGTTLEPEEKEEIQSQHPLLLAEADEYVAKNPLFAQYGITSWKEFSSWYEDAVYGVSGTLTEEQEKKYADAHRMLNYLQGEETENINERISATDLYLQCYELWETEGVDHITKAYVDGYTPFERSNAQRTLFGEDQAWRNILPYEVVQATSTYFAYLLIWMVLSACLLTSPLLVRDRLSRLLPLQWSSRLGRNTSNMQFLAVELTSIGLTTLNLIVFGGLFATNGTNVFLECRLFSFTHTGFVWFNCTYGAWCAILILLCYLVTAGVVALAFFLSRGSENYIAMLLKLIPVFVVIAILCPRLLEQLFYYSNRLYLLSHIPGIEILVTSLIVLTGPLLCTISLRRQKKSDLLL